MRVLGNILWHFPFLGFINAFLAFFIGTVCTVLVVTAPIGLGLIQYSKFLLAPFSFDMVKKDDLGIQQNPVWRAYSTIVMIIYLPIGIILTAITVIQICGLFLTIVGIPAALVLVKSIGTYFNPVNKICVPGAVGDTVRIKKDKDEIHKYFCS